MTSWTSFPLLWTARLSGTKQVRKDYFSLVTAMYEEAFFQADIQTGAGKYGLKLTGHTEEFLWGTSQKAGRLF